MDNSKEMTTNIRHYKNIILEYINQEEIKELKNNNEEEYISHIFDKFQYFRTEYPKIFDVIISDNNIDMLEVMLNSIDHLNKSNNVQEDLHKIRYTLGQKLHDIYVKDKIK